MSVTVDTVAPAAPTIASFSTDSGTVGDHITNDATLTLTGTAEANSTVKVYDGATLLGSVDRQWQRSLELYDGSAGDRSPQPDRDCERRSGQYQCGVFGTERDHRHDRTCRTDHCVVLA